MATTAAAGNGVVRIAATADLHFAKHPPPPPVIQELLAQVGHHADVLLVCGDLTDRGLPEEAHLLARAITGTVKVPVVAVLGNHDFESGCPDEVKNILADAGIVMLDGDAQVVEGIGFAGVKGFAGGFGKRALGPWGEKIIKDFVREAVDEALKLESALARLRRVPRVAVLHYSPIEETVEGEPCEIYPFLGCSRLEEPLSRYPVAAVFHGHAHRGRPEGKTAAGTPVYNVAMGVLQSTYPDRLPFRVIEVPRDLP
ncbi:MAG TPA: metallophosphoesterase [Thermoanaerobaculia bacterium]